MNSDMRKQETQITELDPPEIAAGQAGAQSEEAVQVPEQRGAPASGETQAAESSMAPAAELEKVKAERDQLLDRIARLQAEFENARKRSERDKLDFRDFTTGNVIEQFLPVIDNFDLALKSKGNADQLRSGVELIIKQMQEVLQKMQVTPVPTIGEAFDPRVHEALGTVERDDIPDQHVAEEIRRGYRMRDRMLRPALVRVAHNPKQKSE